MKKPKFSPLKYVALAAEKDAIRTAIAKHGTRVRAAQSLGITTQTLRQKLAAR